MQLLCYDHVDNQIDTDLLDHNEKQMLEVVFEQQCFQEAWIGIVRRNWEKVVGVADLGMGLTCANSRH